MKNYRLLTIVFVMIFIAGGVLHFRKESGRATKETVKEESLKAVLPGARSFSKETGEFPYYKGYKTTAQTDTDLVGFAFFSADIVPEITGYAGPIPMAIGMSPEGKITKVHVLSHSETSSYISNLDSFLGQFASKSIHDPFELGKDLDGISRATITSTAIARAVETSLDEAGRSILQMEAAGPAAPKKPLAWDEILIPLVLFGVAVAGILTHKQNLRWIALFGGFVYFGIVKSTMVSVVHFVNIGLMSFPSFEQSPLWYMLMGLTLLTTFLFGMVFCGSLCPFAAVEELLYNLVHRKKRFPERPLSNKVDQKSRYIKYLVLFTAVAVSAFLGNSGPASIEPFLTLFTLNGTFLAWSLLALMLLLAFSQFRFWCKYLCPVGACLGLFSRFSLYKIKLGDNCSQCAACEKICPTRAIRMDETGMPRIDYPECILCGKCVRVCPMEKTKNPTQKNEQ
ncbi:MAG: FMN-binding protein [Candidatus Omnitrophica bacterium]|nr:FMN-binding protein [Candidatus Omnitrophota bacterium]